MASPPQDCEVDSSGNRSCLQCGKEDPQWIMVEPGIGTCPDCSGVHRSLSNDRPVENGQPENETPEAADLNNVLPSSSVDVVPPMVAPPPLPPQDDEDEDDDDDYDDYDMDDVYDRRQPYMPRHRRRSLGEATIELIAKHFWTPRPLRRDQDPGRVHRLFHSHLRAIPKHERVMFLHKIDGLCYDYVKNNRV